jgi:hypothetical protein
MPIRIVPTRSWRCARLTLALALTLAPSLAAGPAVPPATAGLEVYVAGSADNVRPAATLWRNGEAAPVGGAPRFARAMAMALDGGDVYLCGWADQPPLTLGSTRRFVRTPMVWKNGAASPLTAGTTWGVALGLAADGGALYVVGSEDERARLWKDGRPLPLETREAPSWARGVARCGADLLVVGNEWSGEDGASVAMVWRNGKPAPLTDGRRDACASAVAVAGGDYYVAGYESNGRVRVAKVWKNGKPFLTLSDGTRSAEAEAVKVAGDLVVTVGHEAVGDPIRTANGPADVWAPVATVWRNAVPVRLTDGRRFAWAHAVDLAGDRIIATGEEQTGAGGEGNNASVTVWTVGPDGRPGPATRLTGGDSVGNGVAVAVGAAAPAGPGPRAGIRTATAP